MSRIGDWVDTRLPYRRLWKKYATEYYLPKNLNFYYIFGSLALVVLLNQLLTGFFLTIFYTPTVTEAFHSIQYIMRDVRFGWLIRYMHTTGSSALFIILYLHIFRGLLYGSYQKPRELVWIFGMFLFFLLISQASSGYLLPWGQLSFWGAQVLTNLVGSIPYIGEFITFLIRGDYVVSDVTLHRFFALHVIGIPLLVLFFVGLHIISLRQVGSNNPKGVDFPLEEKIPFHPFYTVKDAVAALGFFIGFFVVVFYFPDMDGYFLDSDNATPANPMVTPDAITPLWYLSPFYAMLRAIPDKLFGVLVMGSSMILLLFLPWLDRGVVRTIRNKNRFSQCTFIMFVMSFMGLGVLGMQEITAWSLILARTLTAFYFAYFILMPWFSRRDKPCDV